MKKITLLFAMLIASFGFSQTNLGDLGVGSNSKNFGNSTIGASRAPCAYTQPIAGTPDGYPIGVFSLNEIADDFDVLPDATFTPDTFITNVLLANPNTVTAITINFYGDSGGVPGGLLFNLQGQAPISQTIVGTAFGRDIIEVVFDLTSSGVSFDGTPVGAKFWVGLSWGVDSSGSADMFVDVTDTVISNECATQLGSTGWSPGSVVFGSARDIVMSLSGDCSLTLISVCGIGNPQPVPASGTGGPDCLGGPAVSPATIIETGIIGVDFSLESVQINVDHTWDADMDITLHSPSGTFWNLSTDNGTSGDNYRNTIFSDGFPSITTGSAPFNGTFEAEGGPFATGFAGEDIQGDWSLIICDDNSDFTGELLSYCINFVVFTNPPVIVCPVDITVNTDNGICGAVVNFSDAVAIDPDGDLDTVVQTSGLPSGSLFPVGISTVEFTATDLAGNTATCTFSITVIDNEAPAIVCQDITLELDSSGTITISAEDLLSDFSDNCGIGSVVAGSPALPSGELTTLFAFDNGGGDGGAVYFDVLVGPEIINVNSIDVNTSDPGAMSIEVYTLVGTSVGNEQDPTPWSTMTTGVGIGMGGNTPSNMVLGVPLVLSANTNYGIAIVMDSTHRHLYTNGDGTNQSYTNTDLSMELGSAASVPFSSAIFTPRVFNGTFNYTIGSSIGVIPQGATVDFDCSLLGVNLLEVTVVDVHGNTSTCTSTVTVEDNLAPEIVCIGEPNNISDFQDFETSTLPSGWSTVIVSGNFDWTFGSGAMPTGANFPTNAAIFDDDAIGAGELDNTVELYSPVYNMTGASSATLSFDYSLIVFNTFGEFTAEAWDGATWQQILFVEDDIVPTNSGVIDVISMANSAFQVRFRYDDENEWAWGAGVDNFKIDYNTPAAPMEVDLDSSGLATIDVSDLLLEVTEGCQWIATVGSAGVQESLTTLFAADNGGNFGGAVYFDVAVGAEDLNITSIDVNSEELGAMTIEVYTLVGTSVGNEQDPTPWSIPTNGAGEGLGLNIPSNMVLDAPITLLAGTNYGMAVVMDSSHGHDYTTGDGTNEFYSDANLSITLGSANNTPFDGTVFSPRVFNTALNYILVGGISTTIDFSCDDLGSNEIEITVTDNSGNVSTCIATVVVNDVTPPILVCTDITIELDENGVATIDPEDLLAQAPGTYEVITISSDNQSGLPGDTDFTVPVIIAEGVSFDWNYSTLDGPFWDSFGYLLNGIYTELTDPSGDITQSGNTSLSVEVGDIFGFRSHSEDGTTGAATTVISNFLPGFTDQFDPANWILTLDNSDGDAYFVSIPAGPLSFDACGITTLATDVTQVSCDDIGSPVTVTVFASDASSNVATCQSIVTVVDLLPPVVTCPDDQIILVQEADPFWEVRDYFLGGEATAIDNCTDPVEIFSQDPAAGTILGVGVYTITLGATDKYGNVSDSCTFTLTIELELGTQDNILDNSIVIYPNPAKDRVTFVNRSGISLEKATIYDLNGRVIFNVDLRDMQQEKTVDVSSLSSGVYIVQFQGEDATAIKRLVKE